MQRFLAPLTAAVLLCTVSLAVQERVSKPKAKDFVTIVDEAKVAFAAKRFGAAAGGLREAYQLATKEHRKVVLAAFPAPPSGWTFEADTDDDDADAPAALAGLAMLTGAGVGGDYTHPDGDGRMQATVQIDSPMVQMFTMMTSNPALLDKNSELVKYGPHTALLRTRTKGSSYELQLLLGDDFLQVDLEGADDDLLLAVWNQAAIDKLAAALAN